VVAIGPEQYGVVIVGVVDHVTRLGADVGHGDTLSRRVDREVNDLRSTSEKKRWV
jgi:hypothetical protein